MTIKDGDPETIVPGLMAIGEAACVSVHGANRLGSNSLLDIVVFGRAAALRAAELITPGEKHKPLSDDATDSIIGHLDEIRNASGGTPTADLRDNMQRTMQKHAAVFREGASLDEGVTKMQGIFDGFGDVDVTDRSLIWNTDLVETLELENLLLQSQSIIHGAANRTESRGGHARDDFEHRDDDNWMKHTVTWVDNAGKVSIDYRPVHMYTLSEDTEVIPPKARVY